MIKTLNLSDDTIARRVLQIQRLAYQIEADLIGFDGIPGLHETLEELQQSDEQFAAYFVDDVIAGLIAYKIEDTTLEIWRMVVHPDYFRRGIARALMQYVMAITGIKRVIVSTGRDNLPARQLYERLDFRLIEHITLPEGPVISRYENQL